MVIIMSDDMAKTFENGGTTRLSPTCGKKDIGSHTTVFLDFFFKEDTFKAVNFQNLLVTSINTMEC